MKRATIPIRDRYYGGFRCRGGGRTPYDGRSGYGGRDNRVVCQLCGKIGHVGLKCFKRIDVYFTGIPSSSSSPQAFLSDTGALDYQTEESYSDPYYDNSWYVDSGAPQTISHTT